MRLVLDPVDTLPRLAWCARIDRRRSLIRVLHGPDVDPGDDRFSEGAWSGDFGAGAFERCACMGSGGKLTERGLLIASPNHTMERIWVLERRDQILISNSCAFVLAQAGDGPDPDYLMYLSRIASVIDGLDRYPRSIPTRNGNRIRMYCHCNLLLDRDYRLTELPKPPVREFRDFADYRSFLDDTVAALAANAADRRRRVRYRPLVTVSTGYDSPVAAVLARKVGCTEAVTFRRTRPDHRGQLDDCGAAIARILGLEVTVYDRLDYRDRTGFPEAEGGISEFLALADRLEGRLLFTGFHGAVWDRSWTRHDGFIRRRDDSGNNLAELRLRVGFVHVAVPYLGCTAERSIHRISTSEEMRPWSVGGGYDKPIARRIVEEAGVPRDLFGVEKKAVAVAARLEGFERVMTPQSFADFSGFVARHRSLRRSAAIALDRLELRLRQAWNRRIRAAPHRLARLLTLPVPPGFLPRPGSWGYNTLLFHWSLEKLIPRYRVEPADCRAAVEGA